MMPKATMEGATYYGHEGIVVDANDKLSEVDPSRNLDGSVVEGFESDEREIEDRPGSEQSTSPLRGLPDAPTFVEFTRPEQEPTPESPEESEDESEKAPARKTATRGARK